MTIKGNYVLKSVVLNKDNTNFFTVDNDNRRQLRHSKIEVLRCALNSGEHFQAVMVANKIDSKRVLIDGNHRYEAIIKAIETDPTIEIKVSYAEYKNLDKIQESEAFRLWNIGTKQSGDDFIKVNLRNIELGETILNEVPLCIYKTPNKMQIKHIAGAHLNATAQLKFQGLTGTSGTRLVSKLKEFTKNDIKFMKSFRKDMEYIFEPMSSDNIYFKPVLTPALYRIWYDNAHVPIETFKKAFLNILEKPSNRYKWKQLLRMNGREACMVIYEEIMTDLERKSCKRGYAGINFGRERLQA